MHSIPLAVHDYIYTRDVTRRHKLYNKYNLVSCR